MSNKGKGRPASDWLREVTKDQNLSDLDQLEVTLMNEFRNWFRSAILQPVLITGYYDEDTGKYVLGRQEVNLEEQLCTSPEDVTTDTQVNTGAAAATLTVAAGHVYRIIGAYTKNSTRLPFFTADLTPNGGSAAQICDTSAGGPGQGENGYYVGGAGESNLTCPGLGGTLWMQAGDTLTVTQSNYVGGDTVEHGFVFEDYTL
jgi:hypothetical protein